jgi:ParB/RepB/Spo0J family partition protein
MAMNGVEVTALTRQTSKVIEAPLDDINIGYERLRLVRPGEHAVMRESVCRYGQISPVIVGHAIDGSRRYELVDGFKRYRACRELDKKDMTIRIMEGGIHAMKAAIINLNCSQGSLHAFEEALVVGSLYREDCLNQQQIAALFGRHKSWACRRIALCERLCEEAVEHIRLGLLGFATVRELCRLPRGNQPQALACVMKHRLSSREATLLVQQLLQSPQWEHECILRLPVDILDRRSPPRPAKATSAARAYHRLCLTLTAACTQMETAQSHVALFDVAQRDALREKTDRVSSILLGLKTALGPSDAVY